MEIVVNDTNIFIDLCKLNILAEFFMLPMKMHTTDFVIAELQDESQHEQIMAFHKNGKLHVQSFSPVELLEIIRLQSDAGGNVSLTDCSAWHYAKVNNYTLLTGDGQLRKKAVASNVTVHGLLYIFDLLVSEHIIEPECAANKLKELLILNRRMPRKQIEEMIKTWVKT